MTAHLKLGLLLILVPAPAAAAERPNVVILYADDMGIGDVGAYGCPDIRTPNIDRLAETGIRFTQYYSAASICSPSRAALLTGRYPARAGVPSNVSSTPGVPGMPAEQLTIAELAGTRGYATALVGKWHLGFSDDTAPNAQGFDFFFGHHSGCIDYYSHVFYWDPNIPHHHDLFRNRQRVREEGQYFTELITREAARFIDEHRERPFLLYVAYNAPHYPMQAPQRYLDRYEHLPERRRDYAALVASMDDSIGTIVDRLHRNDLSARTLIFFASDNGPSTEIRAGGGGGSSGPFRGHKFSLFEGGIRMPAILSWPGRTPSGQTRDQLVMAIDVFPTLADAMGAATPPDHAIDGLSWMPLLADAAAPGHETLFWSHREHAAVRQGNWKLLRNPLETREGDRNERLSGDDAVFLADLEADPGETRNLRSQHPDIAEDLLKLLDEWRAAK